MKNLKLFWVDFVELFPLPLLWGMFMWWLLFFGLWGLWSQMWFVYFWLWLEAIAVLLFILSNISKSIKLFNDGKITKAIVRLILIWIFTVFAVYFWYNLYLSLTF